MCATALLETAEWRVVVALPSDCEARDFDLDGDVDLFDFASFQIEFGGSQ